MTFNGRFRFSGFLVLVFSFGFCGQAQQQSASSVASDGQVRLHALKDLHLAQLSGGLPTYYSKGYERQARYTRDLIGDEFSFYKKFSHTQAPPAILAVLDTQQWSKPAQGLPYGLPSVSEHLPFVIVMPAAWDKVQALPLPQKGDVSTSDLSKVLSGGNSWEEVRFQGGYGVASHEIGHAVIKQLKIDPQVNWFTELLASYIGYAYLDQVHPEVMLGNELFWKYGLGAPHPHTTLDYFESHYDMVGYAPLNYVWYQVAFDVEGLSVYRALGVDFVPKVQAAFPEGGMKLNTQQVLDKLETIRPGWKAWAARLEAGHLSPQDIQIEGPIH